MEIDENRLLKAAQAGIITDQQAQQLWLFLKTNKITTEGSKSEETSLSKFLYYFGAMVVIGAMSWFLNNTWERFGGAGVFLIALTYGVVFIFFARFLRKSSVTLSGLMIIMAVCMTPLATFGMQKWLGFWPYSNPEVYKDFHRFIRAGGFIMELTTLAAGILALRHARIPLVTAPIALTLWYLSIDITPIVFGPDLDWHMRKAITLLLGITMVAIAFWVDRRKTVDYAKWLYIFGALMFWSALTSMKSQSEWANFGYCVVNCFLLGFGILLERRIFLVLGSLGVFGYIGYLAWYVFRYSMFFPFVLTGVGLLVILAGWFYHRNLRRIEKSLQSLMPCWLVAILPQNRRLKK